MSILPEYTRIELMSFNILDNVLQFSEFWRNSQDATMHETLQ